jgi:methylated-DNA-protein-cysteine methyltransferase-like protein
MMSEFKKAVLKVVTKIPPGKVVNYGQVALLAGVPRAARQVGNILCQYGESVPWWRVINNAGHISTTCLDHTAKMQKEKLINEGVSVGKNLKIDIEHYRWLPRKKILEELQLEEGYVEKLMETYFS